MHIYNPATPRFRSGTRSQYRQGTSLGPTGRSGWGPEPGCAGDGTLTAGSDHTSFFLKRLPRSLVGTRCSMNVGW